MEPVIFLRGGRFRFVLCNFFEFRNVGDRLQTCLDVRLDSFFRHFGQNRSAHEVATFFYFRNVVNLEFIPPQRRRNIRHNFSCRRTARRNLYFPRNNLSHYFFAPPAGGAKMFHQSFAGCKFF